MTASHTIYRSTAHELQPAMRAFLDQQRFLTLATLDPDGTIHLVPTWYLIEDDHFLIATSAGSRKARNVAARSTATVTVDDRRTASWVSARGTAEVVRGEDSRRMNARLRRRYMTAAGLDALEPTLEEAEDATIVVTPQRWAAWDYETAMLPVIEQAGIPLTDADRWYLP